MPLLDRKVVPPDSRDPAVPSAGIASQIGSGFTAGVLDTPIVGDLAEEVALLWPTVKEEDIRRVVAAGESTPLARGTKLVSEIGISMVGGGLAYAGGRALGRMALAAASRGATTGALAPAAAFFGDVAGSAAPVTRVPGVVKAAQAAGGALGVGALSGAQEATKPDATLGSIATAVGIGAGSTLALEGLLAGAGAGARKLGLLKPPPSAARLVELRAKSASTFDEAIAGREARMGQLRQRIAAVLGRDRQEAALARRADPQLRLFDDLPAAKKPVAPAQGALFEEPTRRLGRLAVTPQQERAFLTAQKQLRRARVERDALVQARNSPIPVTAMRGSNPLNPSDAGLMAQKALLRFAKSPETMGRELGPTGVKLVQLGQEAEALTTIGKSAVRARLVTLRSEAAKAMGVRRTGGDGKWFAPAVEAWERGGIEGVRAFNSKLVPIFQEIDDYVLGRYGAIAKMGGEPAMTANDLTRRGVRAFFPQIVDFDRVGRDAFRGKFGAALAKSRGISADEGLLLADDILGKQLRGLRQFGSIDYQRALPGSTAEKIAQLGLPLVDDPWHALERYATALERRIAYGQRFGYRGELRDPLVAAISKEGGNRELASSVADVFLSRKFYDGAMERWAGNVVNLQIGSKLPLAVVANLSQNVNSAFLFGMRRTAKHMFTALRPEHSDDVLKGTALGESVLQGMREAWLEPGMRTPMGRFANFTLTASGFARVERYNRLVAGAAAEATYIDDVLRGSLGRLRGTNLLAARRRWGNLGIDLDDAVRNVRSAGGFDAWQASAAGKKALTQAIFAGSRATQFISAPSRIPTDWQHPVGRVLMQFHSFSFNQAKFLRDAVLREASEGNLKPLAGFLSMYPVVGDMVGDVRSLISGREPRDFDGLAAYLDNFLYVGGLGLATDAYMAARYGRFESFILGPTVSDIGDLVERMATGDVDGLLTDLRKEPIVTAASRLFTLAGSGVAIGAKAIEEYLDSGTKGE